METMATRTRRSRGGNGPENTFNPTMIQLYPVARLREELAARGLDTKGNKQTLADRLEEAFKDSSFVCFDNSPIKKESTAASKKLKEISTVLNESAAATSEEAVVEENDSKILTPSKAKEVKPKKAAVTKGKKSTTPAAPKRSNQKKKAPEPSTAEEDSDSDGPPILEAFEDISPKRKSNKKVSKPDVEASVSSAELVSSEKKEDVSSETKKTDEEKVEEAADEPMEFEEAVEKSSKKPVEKSAKKPAVKENDSRSKSLSKETTESSEALENVTEPLPALSKTKTDEAKSRKKSVSVDIPKKPKEVTGTTKEPSSESVSKHTTKSLTITEPASSKKEQIKEKQNKDIDKSKKAELPAKQSTDKAAKSTLAATAKDKPTTLKKSIVKEAPRITTEPPKSQMGTQKLLKPPTSQAPNRPIPPPIRKPAPVAKKPSTVSVDILDSIIGDQTVLLHDKFKTEQEKSEERQNLELEKRRKSTHAFHLPPMEKKPRDTSRPRPSMDIDFDSPSPISPVARNTSNFPDPRLATSFDGTPTSSSSSPLQSSKGKDIYQLTCEEKLRRIFPTALPLPSPSSSRPSAKIDNALNLPPPPPPPGPPPANAKRLPAGPPPTKKSKTIVDALPPPPPPSMPPPPTAKRIILPQKSPATPSSELSTPQQSSSSHSITVASSSTLPRGTEPSYKGEEPMDIATDEDEEEKSTMALQAKDTNIAEASSPVSESTSSTLPPVTKEPEEDLTEDVKNVVMASQLSEMPFEESETMEIDNVTTEKEDDDDSPFVNGDSDLYRLDADMTNDGGYDPLEAALVVRTRKSILAEEGATTDESDTDEEESSAEDSDDSGVSDEDSNDKSISEQQLSTIENDQTEMKQTVDQSTVSKLAGTPSLLAKANAILQDIENSQVQIHQEEFVGDYQAIEEEKAPVEFHGEPVPDDEDDDDALFEMAAGLPKKKREPKPIEEEPLPVDEFVELDYYNADLNIKASAQNKWLIDPDNGDGFALMFGGVRSNYGIIAPAAEEKFPRIAFQIQITEFLSLKHVPFEELDPHDVRIGWSVQTASNVLGESSKSYAFCSIGRKLNDGVFQKYHDIFQKDDIITTVLDFEKQEISYYKNDVFLGVAFSNDLFSPGDLVFPHISIKNCKVLVNFGLECPDPENADKWKLPSDEPEDTAFVAKLDKSCLKATLRPPKDKSDCTVIMMVGIPGVGKTTWVKNYLREHPEEKWIHINSESFLAAMKVNGVQRKRVSTRWDMILGLAAKAFCRTLTLACRRRHNYIIDQTNCNRESRKRRLTLFEGFHRKCVVICPSDQVAEERRLRRSDPAGEMPVEALLELKATMSLPNNEVEPFEDVAYVEPPVERISEAIELVERYNQEGQPWIRKHKKFRPNNSVISDHRGHSNNWIGNDSRRQHHSGGMNNTVGGGGRIHHITTSSNSNAACHEHSNAENYLQISLGPIVGNNNISSASPSPVTPPVRIGFPPQASMNGMNSPVVPMMSPLISMPSPNVPLPHVFGMNSPNVLPMTARPPPSPMVSAPPQMLGSNAANQSTNQNSSLEIQVDFSVPPPGYMPTSQNSSSSSQQPSG